MARQNKIVYTIIWILLLIFLAWPIAGFCAAWWVFFLPFEGLHDICKFIDCSKEWSIRIGLLYRYYMSMSLILYLSSHFLYWPLITDRIIHYSQANH